MAKSAADSTLEPRKPDREQKKEFPLLSLDVRPKPITSSKEVIAPAARTATRRAFSGMNRRLFFMSLIDAEEALREYGFGLILTIKRGRAYI